MKITKNHVVEIKYTLKNNEGSIIDTSDGEGKAPLKYLHGHGMLVPKLEGEIEGKIIGDKFSKMIEAKDGYGLRDEKMIQTISKAQFENSEDIKIGTQFQTETPDGHMMLLTVTAVEGENVTVDGNHALADVDLYFEVEVLSIREATKEEIEHGHVH